MTRAHIADPDLIAHARDAGSGTGIACVGANACIAHYHAGTPIACAVNPRTGRERTLRAPRVAATPGRRVTVIGAGPAGLAGGVEAAQSRRCGDRARTRRGDRGSAAPGRPGPGPCRAVVALPRRDRRAAAGGRGHGAARGRPPPPTTLTSVTRRWSCWPPARGPTDPRARAAAELATVTAWAAISEPQAVTGPVLVSDWGGGWEGLDAAERLAGAGHAVTLACARDDAGGDASSVPAQPATSAAWTRSGCGSSTTPRSCPDRACATSTPGAKPRSRAMSTAGHRARARARRHPVARARGPSAGRPGRRRARPAHARGGGARRHARRSRRAHGPARSAVASARTGGRLVADQPCRGLRPRRRDRPSSSVRPCSRCPPGVDDATRARI